MLTCPIGWSEYLANDACEEPCHGRAADEDLRAHASLSKSPGPVRGRGLHGTSAYLTTAGEGGLGRVGLVLVFVVANLQVLDMMFASAFRTPKVSRMAEPTTIYLALEGLLQRVLGHGDDLVGGSDRQAWLCWQHRP